MFLVFLAGLWLETTLTVYLARLKGFVTVVGTSERADSLSLAIMVVVIVVVVVIVQRSQ